MFLECLHVLKVYNRFHLGLTLETALETLLAGDQLVLEYVDHLDVLPVLVEREREREREG